MQPKNGLDPIHPKPPQTDPILRRGQPPKYNLAIIARPAFSAALVALVSLLGLVALEAALSLVRAEPLPLTSQLMPDPAILALEGLTWREAALSNLAISLMLASTLAVLVLMLALRKKPAPPYSLADIRRQANLACFQGFASAALIVALFIAVSLSAAGAPAGEAAGLMREGESLNSIQFAFSVLTLTACFVALGIAFWWASDALAAGWKRFRQNRRREDSPNA